MYKILANTIFLGKHVQYLPECHSTNDMALQLVKNRQVAEGSVVITDAQINGKGQRGNSWQSNPGENLTFSLVLSPKFLDISEQFFLNMMVSNSLRQLLSEYIPDLKVKWPNDLVVPDFGKIGGVLIENIFGSDGWEYAIVGMGININQISNLSARAVSLKSMTGSEFDLQELFQLIVTQIEQGYLKLKKNGVDLVKQNFEQHMFQYQEWKSYEDSSGTFTGRILGVTGEGNLQVEKKDGTQKYFGLKEIRFLW